MDICRALTVMLFGIVIPSGLAQSLPIEVEYKPQVDGPKLRIVNHQSLPITAVVIRANSGPNTDERLAVVMCFDAIVNINRDRSILPNEGVDFPVPYIEGRDLNALQPEVVAVIFQDGTYWGEEPWANNALKRRKRLHDQLNTAIALLASARNEHWTKDAIKAHFEQARNSASKTALDSDLQEMDRRAFEITTQNIDNIVATGRSMDEALGAISKAWRSWIKLLAGSLNSSMATTTKIGG